MGNRKQTNDVLNSYANMANQQNDMPSSEYDLQDTDNQSIDDIVNESLNAQGYEHVCPQCAARAEADDTHLRALAEMDNFKKRLNREWEEKSKYLTEAVLADLLPSLDSLDLAILYGSRDEACKNLLTGVTMTHKMLFDALRNHGLTSVGELGEPFNPEYHEAVAQEERADMEPGHICALMQRGYNLKGRLLRPAKVSVSAKK